MLFMYPAASSRGAEGFERNGNLDNFGSAASGADAATLGVTPESSLLGIAPVHRTPDETDIVTARSQSLRLARDLRQSNDELNARLASYHAVGQFHDESLGLRRSVR